VRRIEIKKIAKMVKKAASDKQGIDFKALDVSKVSSLADYFIIVSGATTRQVKALVDEIDYVLSAKKIYPTNVEGLPEARWVLMDYGDLVVHVFEAENRDFYDLDGLWGDAPEAKL
jgi:ribosome-associated protein